MAVVIFVTEDNRYLRINEGTYETVAYQGDTQKTNFLLRPLNWVLCLLAPINLNLHFHKWRSIFGTLLNVFRHFLFFIIFDECVICVHSFLLLPPIP